MKFFLVIAAFKTMLMSSTAAQLTNLKIDSKWRIKYDAKEWSYIYLKPMAGISANVFENKKEKIKVILQRETHSDNVANSQNLIASKCAEAHNYYAKNFSGSAEVVVIANKKICYIQYKNVSGNLSHQFVYPEPSVSKNYDLYSYAWNSEDQKSKEVVTTFLKGILK